MGLPEIDSKNPMSRIDRRINALATQVNELRSTRDAAPRTFYDFVSPDGTIWRATVSNAGVLSVALIP